MEEIFDSDISSSSSQSVRAVEGLKLNEQHGNVIENKGPEQGAVGRSGNVIENKRSYVQNTGMLLKTKGLDKYVDEVLLTPGA
jgi:hypothetical protein